MAMNRAARIAAALAMVAGTVLGCGQNPAAEPVSAGPTRAGAPTTSTPVAVSVTDPVVAEAAQAPVAFTGRIACGDVVRAGVDEAPTDGGPVRRTTRGWAWQPTATMSDSRLEGNYYISYDSDDYESPTGTSISTGTWRIENGEGAWQGSFTNIMYPGSTTTVSTALVGEGAHDGLTAVWESTHHGPQECVWTVRGLIVEGDVPAAPKPYTGDE